MAISVLKQVKGISVKLASTKSNDEPISASNLLVYEGRFYSVGSSRLNVQMDKTVNQDAFILSLPAIANAIDKVGVEGKADVILGIGLPIVNYGTLKKKFREYFIRQDVRFTYNKKDYHINIVDSRVYPQGYASLITVFNSYKGVLCKVIDIGGFMVDIFKVENGIINTASCFSLPDGIITLIAKIQQELLKLNIRLTESQIQDMVIGREPVIFDADVKKIIENMTKEYVENILSKIEEYGFEFRNPSIFTGGGSMMLQNYIQKANKVKYADFLDQFANARGYKILLQQELSRW